VTGTSPRTSVFPRGVPMPFNSAPVGWRIALVPAAAA